MFSGKIDGNERNSRFENVSLLWISSLETLEGGEGNRVCTILITHAFPPETFFIPLLSPRILVTSPTYGYYLTQVFTST